MNPSAFVPEDGEVVLIVDDNESLRESLSEVLKSAGIRSVDAGSAHDALRLQAIHLPTVAVVDYRLPDGSGIELAHTIKERNPDTSVIILTGFATLDTAVDAVGQFDAYLIKPVAPQMFIRTVVNALAHRRLVAENGRLVERLEQVNAYQALHDPLTGLPNRALLDDRLRQALAGCQRTGLSVAVLFIDLDEFKVVNDLFGHQVGDHLLRNMAKRLADSCRQSDSVARFGGDEFIVVCPVKVSADACRIAAHLLETLAEPTTIEGVEHHITGSIGIAVTGSGAPQQSAETLLRDADTAMYRAKEAGRARWELFDNAMRARVMDRFEIERGLRNALEDGGLANAYQPLVDIQSGSLVGAEALVRWDRAGHGTLLPGSFLDVAEDSGLIVPIGTWVLDKALSDLAQWKAEGTVAERFRLWVNISPCQITVPQFPGLVRDLLDAHGVEPESLGLEILEQALVDMGASVKVLWELREMGVSLNLDDFGAGHSNLSWLRELPITGIKIDRQFVAGLGVQGNDRGPAIVSGLIKLCEALGLVVIGEGVETEAQANALSSMGCQLAQGYYFGYPREDFPSLGYVTPIESETRTPST